MSERLCVLLSEECFHPTQVGMCDFRSSPPPFIYQFYQSLHVEATLSYILVKLVFMQKQSSMEQVVTVDSALISLSYFVLSLKSFLV